MGEVNYTLPEWAMLSSSSHEGDLLGGRTVLVHSQSFTVMEVIPFEDLAEFELKGPSMGVEYSDEYGECRKICFTIYFTLSLDIDGIFEKVASWYGEYLDWRDKNKMLEDKMKKN